jgi:hypothetical protein
MISGRVAMMSRKDQKLTPAPFLYRIKFLVREIRNVRVFQVALTQL